jgi:agmatine deiminase
MKKISTIPDWIRPKEIVIVWPENLPSGVGISLAPFYKRLIKAINNVSMRILINSNTIPKSINQSNVIAQKFNTGDIWLRDFMPIAAQGVNSQYCKFKYNPSYLAEKDEAIRLLGDSSSGRLKKHFPNHILNNENLNLDGGNFISNGVGAAITTNRIISDNQNYSITEIEILFNEKLGIDNLIILPVEPGDITGHVDGMVRFIDESSVVVGDYPSTYPLGKEFMEKISNTLNQSGFKVVRILNDAPELPKRKFPNAVGNYINYLRVGNTIYLPVYKNKKLLNSKAIIDYESLGLEVIPVYSDEIAEYGGVLNCITWHYY